MIHWRNQTNYPNEIHEIFFLVFQFLASLEEENHVFYLLYRQT